MVQADTSPAFQYSPFLLLLHLEHLSFSSHSNPFCPGGIWQWLHQIVWVNGRSYSNKVVGNPRDLLPHPRQSMLGHTVDSLSLLSTLTGNLHHLAGLQPTSSSTQLKNVPSPESNWGHYWGSQNLLLEDQFYISLDPQGFPMNQFLAFSFDNQ